MAEIIKKSTYKTKDGEDYFVHHFETQSDQVIMKDGKTLQDSIDSGSIGGSSSWEDITGKPDLVTVNKINERGYLNTKAYDLSEPNKCDSLINNGKYSVYIDENYKQLPIGYYNLEVINHRNVQDSRFVTQIMHRFSGPGGNDIDPSDRKLYSRVMFNEVWKEWKCVSDGGNANTLDGLTSKDYLKYTGGGVGGALQFQGIRPIQWHCGRSEVSEIFWNASADVDYGLITRVDGQDVIVTKSDCVNIQKPLYANNWFHANGISTGSLTINNYGNPFECGKYIDFHDINSTNDYDGRLYVESGHLMWNGGYISMNITDEINNLKSFVVDGKNLLTTTINDKLGFNSGLSSSSTWNDFSWCIGQIPSLGTLNVQDASSYTSFNDFPLGRKLGKIPDGGSIQVSSYFVTISDGTTFTLTGSNTYNVYVPYTGKWTTYTNPSNQSISAVARGYVIIINVNKNTYSIGAEYSRNVYSLID